MGICDKPKCGQWILDRFDFCEKHVLKERKKTKMSDENLSTNDLVKRVVMFASVLPRKNSVKTLRMAAERLQSQSDTLEKVKVFINKHSYHAPDCSYITHLLDTENGCDCGLDEALALLEKQK